GGKTTLARSLGDHWPYATPPQQIALDSIYPGWSGLNAGPAHAIEHILRPHARAVTGKWHRWDRERGVQAESHPVDPGRAIIWEGCGAITAESARLAEVRIWVESPDASRKSRALARDGEIFARNWDRWADQELVHIRRDQPRR